MIRKWQGERKEGEGKSGDPEENAKSRGESSKWQENIGFKKRLKGREH